MTDAEQSSRRSRSSARSAWFEALRDDLCAAFERLEADLPAGAPLADRAAGRFVRTPWTRADHAGGADGGGGVMSLIARPRVREGRHPHLDRAWRVRAGVPQADPRRRGRPALLGLGRVADRPPASTRNVPDRAHEHAHGRDRQMVVRRRRRPDAGAGPAAHPGGRRYACVPRRHAGGLHAARGRRLRALQDSGARSTSTCRIARRCGASAASSTTI